MENKAPPHPTNDMSVEEMKEMLEYLRGQETKLQAAYTEACKGLTLLNSGAVAAMLAMVQALIGKGAFAPFKLYSVGALTLFWQARCPRPLFSSAWFIA